MAEDEEEPRRGRRGLMIVAALVGAIGLGGGMAYGYKTFFPSRTGPAPVIKDTQGPTKSKPEVADGKGFPHTDKKLLNRLGDETGPLPAARPPPNAAEAPDDRASDDPNAPRKVRLIPITPGGGPQPMPGCRQPRRPRRSGADGRRAGSHAGEHGPAAGSCASSCRRRAPPSAARVQLPPPAPCRRPGRSSSLRSGSLLPPTCRRRQPRSLPLP